ncbi:MAG: glycosyltransferase family 2 protein, partial [Patescibacteria group bacterium]
KGYALKQGVLVATQPLILISDIDWSTPITELPKLWAKINQANLVIGSRKMIGSRVMKHQPWWREWLGRQFTNLSRAWLGLTVSDVTCGFKLFQAPAAKKLFNLAKINRWSYDAEILYLAKKINYKIKEVAVRWKNDEKTKVNLIRDILESFNDLWQIPWHH